MRKYTYAHLKLKHFSKKYYEIPTQWNMFVTDSHYKRFSVHVGSLCDVELRFRLVFVFPIPSFVVS
jgi:hypothetical protein